MISVMRNVLLLASWMIRFLTFEFESDDPCFGADCIILWMMNCISPRFSLRVPTRQVISTQVHSWWGCWHHYVCLSGNFSSYMLTTRLMCQDRRCGVNIGGITLLCNRWLIRHLLGMCCMHLISGHYKSSSHGTCSQLHSITAVLVSS